MRKMLPVQNQKVKLADTFWANRRRTLREETIPYQWKALNDEIEGAARSGSVHNLRVAAGEVEGSAYGPVYQDSDLAKWLEAVGHSLAVHPDVQLEKFADSVINLIARAQQPDGYLNSHFTVAKPTQRWTNLRDWHELYCAGHLIEAGVAYFEATGKTKLLDVVCRLADHIAKVFGTERGQLRGYDGHEEIELALVKLFRATGNRKYLELGKYFIDERGTQPFFFDKEAQQRGDLQTRKDYDYFQAHMPVREQQNAVGHSVRAMYLYAGMADIASETGDPELLRACKTLWKSVTQRQMYVTGGIGSIAHREAFTIDYDLPNDYAYTETCASIGLTLFAHRMLQLEQDSEYANVMERCLYNGILSGVSLDGKSYFYVNPLAVWPDVCQHRSDKKHVKTVRQPWYGTACCPPNLARLIASLGQYFYSVNESELYVHLYASGTMETEIDGQTIRLHQKTEYPWQEQVEITVAIDSSKEFSLAVRIPDWCKNAAIEVNGSTVPLDTTLCKGYAKIKREWSDGDQVLLHLEMPVERIYANPNVRENAGKVALQRGPVVYCLEEVDNGANLPAISLPAENELSVCFDGQLLGGVCIISGSANRLVPNEAVGEEVSLYRSAPHPTVSVPFKAIPYYAWCNREPGEMIVWIRE